MKLCYVKLLIIFSLILKSTPMFYPDSFNANDHPWKDELNTSITPSTSNEKNKFWIYAYRLGDPASVPDYIDQRSGMTYKGILPASHPKVNSFTNS